MAGTRGAIHKVTRKKRVFRDASGDFVDRVPTVEARELQNDPLPFAANSRLLQFGREGKSSKRFAARLQKRLQTHQSCVKGSTYKSIIFSFGGLESDGSTAIC